MSDPNQSDPLSDNPESWTDNAFDPHEDASSPNPQVADPPPQYHLLRQVFSCNPLYLGSAALLLYSFYLISADAAFLPKETQQLAFNLCSLQLYELLLTVTAVFLAFRAIWYDSTLLIGLEHLLVLVPFILISQAALIEAKWVTLLSAAAGFLALARTTVAKRLIPKLNLPPRMLLIGSIIIAVNMALPVVYRMLHETKVGTRPDWGAAYESNQYIWWLVVPALCSLSCAVPLARRSGIDLWPERNWLPSGIFSLWLIGTAVHLYCLGYVYDFSLRPELLAPSIWSLAWLIPSRIQRLAPGWAGRWSTAILALPAIATLVAAPQAGEGVFLALTTLNIGIYFVLFVSRKAGSLLHFSLGSLVALLGGLPEAWTAGWLPQSASDHLLSGAIVIYTLAWLGTTRSPKLALCASLLASLFAGTALNRTDSVHWAIQAGLVYLLLHSFRWNDSTETGEVPVRRVAALAWLGHALAWTWFLGGGWKPAVFGAAVLCFCLLARYLRGNWKPAVLPIAASVICLLVPVHSTTTHVGPVPAGLLAVIGSFLLFTLGTVAALTKRFWHMPDVPLNE